MPANIEGYVTRGAENGKIILLRNHTFIFALSTAAAEFSVVNGRLTDAIPIELRSTRMTPYRWTLSRTVTRYMRMNQPLRLLKEHRQYKIDISPPHRDL